MGTHDVVIVGGGIVGTSAAYYLAQTGHKVLVLDQYQIPNEWSSSGDHAHDFRLTYGKDLFYTELAIKALSLWKEFQKDIREELYVPTGMLELATRIGGYEEHSYRSLSAMNLPVHKLGPEEICERFRIFNSRALRYAVFHPDGGMLWAQRSVAAFASAASRKRAIVHKNAKIVSVIRGKDGIREVRDVHGRSYKASAYLFSPGPWAKEILSSYRLPLKVTRQQILYFRPPNNQGRYRPGHCPIYACHARGFFGFPVHIHGFMKIEDCRKGVCGQPGSGSQEPVAQFERDCRSFLRQFLPDAAGFVDTEGKIYYRNNTPDGDFILDHLPDTPNAVLVTGVSGSGFRFGPLMGKLAIELLLTNKTETNISRFRLSRFRGFGRRK